MIATISEANDTHSNRLKVCSFDIEVEGQSRLHRQVATQGLRDERFQRPAEWKEGIGRPDALSRVVKFLDGRESAAEQLPEAEFESPVTGECDAVTYGHGPVVEIRLA